MGENKIGIEIGKTGVLQSAVLSPLLYILYIDDIKHIIQYDHLVLLADYKNVIYNKQTILETKNNIKHDLNKLGKWFQTHSLTLDINKTPLINFKPKHADILSIECGELKLEAQDFVEFLGVTLDNKHNWEVCLLLKTQYVFLLLRLPIRPLSSPVLELGETQQLMLNEY